MNDIQRILDKNKRPQKNIHEVLLTTDYGKLPPQAIDLEEAVLGALMLERDALLVVADILKPETFYKPNHQKIYIAITELYRKNKPVDILTVTNHLKASGDLDIIGGPYFIAQLTSRVGSAGNIRFHAGVLQEKYMLREAIRISGETMSKAYDADSDAFDLLDNMTASVNQVYTDVLTASEKHPYDIGHEFTEKIKKAQQNKGKIFGVRSGIKELDDVTNGWKEANLIILGARASMGKSAAMMTFAKNAIELDKKKVTIFSLEMTAEQLYGRLFAMKTGVSSDDASRGNFDDEYLKTVRAYLDSLYNSEGDPMLLIDDQPGLNVFDLSTRARKLHEKHGLGLIIIDYFQLLVRQEASQRDMIRELSIVGQQLKALGKELKIPIIALCQLSRGTETGNRRPELHHLRDSGTIEQDADIVGLLYRPDYYYKKTKDEQFAHVEIDGQQVPSEGIMEIIIAKNREGATDNIYCDFVAHTTEIVNLGEGAGHVQKKVYNNWSDQQNTHDENARLRDISKRMHEENEQNTQQNNQQPETPTGTEPDIF